MKQNYILYFIMILICHITYSMEDGWEQKAQNIKKLYNQANELESSGKKKEALKLYIKITKEYFPSIPATNKFQEIFDLKKNANDKVEKLSKEKELVIEKFDDETIWPLAHFIAKVTKFEK